MGLTLCSILGLFVLLLRPAPAAAVLWNFGGGGTLFVQNGSASSGAQVDLEAREELGVDEAVLTAELKAGAVFYPRSGGQSTVAPIAIAGLGWTPSALEGLFVKPALFAGYFRGDFQAGPFAELGYCASCSSTPENIARRWSGTRSLRFDRIFIGVGRLDLGFPTLTCMGGISFQLPSGGTE